MEVADTTLVALVHLLTYDLQFFKGKRVRDAMRLLRSSRQCFQQELLHESVSLLNFSILGDTLLDWHLDLRENLSVYSFQLYLV